MDLDLTSSTIRAEDTYELYYHEKKVPLFQHYFVTRNDAYRRAISDILVDASLHNKNCSLFAAPYAVSCFDFFFYSKDALLKCSGTECQHRTYLIRQLKITGK